MDTPKAWSHTVHARLAAACPPRQARLCATALPSSSSPLRRTSHPLHHSTRRTHFAPGPLPPPHTTPWVGLGFHFVRPIIDLVDVQTWSVILPLNPHYPPVPPLTIEGTLEVYTAHLYDNGTELPQIKYALRYTDAVSAEEVVGSFSLGQAAYGADLFTGNKVGAAGRETTGIAQVVGSTVTGVGKGVALAS